MAYPQQARYPPNDYDAPRSAPLTSPREYRDDGYGQSQYQQDYYNDGYTNGYDGGNGRGPQQQYHQHQPPARHPQQAYPQQQRGPPGSQMRGQNEAHVDRRPGNDPRYGQPQGPYQRGAPQRALQEGGGQTRVRNDYNQQQQYQDYDPAYGQQNYDRGYQQQARGPPANSQAPLQPQPPSQRSHSADGTRGGYQRNLPNQNMMPHNQQHGALDGRGRQPAPLDPSLPKRGKDRVFNSQPTSPDTLAWDNPFPTFPKMEDKKKGERVGKVDSSRPPTGNSRRSEESTHSREQERMLRDPHDLRQNGQAHQLGPGMQPINEDQRSYGPEPQARPNYHRPRPPPQRTYEEPTMSPPQPRFAHDNQRSNTLPNDVSEQMMRTNLPIRPHDYAQPQGVPQQRRSPQPQPAYRVPPDSRPQNNQYRSNSLNHGQGYDAAHSQSQASLYHDSNRAQGGYDDVVDSYHGGPSQSQQAPFNSHATHYAEVEEEEMPNFEAAATDADPEKVLHIGSQASTTSPAVNQERRGRGAERAPDAGFSGQAQRSRSQPNFRNQPNDTHGFDFGLTGQAPDMPPIDPRYAQDNYADRQRQGSDQPPYHQPPLNTQHSPEPRQQQGTGGFGPPPRARTDNFNQGLGPRQRPSPADPFMRGPGVGPSPSPGSSFRNGAPVGGPSPVGLPGPRGPGTPLNASRAVSEGLNSQRGQQMSPPNMNGPSPPVAGRPLNPDALPQHPAPIRPGLMGQTQSPPINNQPSVRPPPVRQDNSGSSGVPSPQPSIPPQPLAPRPKDGLVTPEELQRLRNMVQQNPNDQATQLILAKKMVEAAAVLADEGGRADPKTKARNRERYIFDAHKLIKKLVGQGNTDAMFYLADCHGSGLLGLQKDPKEAFLLYQSAAKLNHPQAAYRVAVCCEMGQDEGGGTRRDPLKAVQWYKRAATLGDVPAMYKIGVIQLKGLLGQPKEPREAVTWLKRAAERADAENPHALHELGMLYLSAGPNDSILRDDAYAGQLFTQAANLGYKASQYRLGAAYEYGHMGFQIDPRASITWYSQAATQEEHQAELALSGWYLTGSEGILAQNDTEAYLWARKAAQAGLAKAEYAMGYFTEVGIGAPADIEAAKRWYWKSASQNFPKARERLEDLRRGGAKMQKTRVSRSAVNKSEGECKVM